MVIDLSAFPLFSGLSAAEERRIAAAMNEPVCYAPGATVYGNDSFRRAVGFILSGSVAVHAAGTGPRTLMMNRLRAGDMFGVAALFDTDDTYVTQITAEEETRIAFLSQETMSVLLAAIPHLAENYIRFLSGRIRFLNRKLAIVTTGHAENRLYQYLSAHQNEDGTVQLPPSMVELAHTLNIGRSSLYRAVDALLNAGVLLREGHTYRLIK